MNELKAMTPGEWLIDRVCRGLGSIQEGEAVKAEIEQLRGYEKDWKRMAQQVTDLIKINGEASLEISRLRAALEHLANLESRLGNIPEERYYEQLAQEALDGEDISAWYREQHGTR